MKIDLHYGKGIVSLQIPEKNIQDVIEPWHSPQQADNADLIAQALADEQVGGFQKQVAGKRLCVLAEDGTRDVPFEDIFGPLANLIKDCSSVLFIVATGTHKPATNENSQITEQLKKSIEGAGISNFRIHAHDSRDGEFVDAGQTSRGTDVLYNTLADSADVFLVLSDLKTHYFAGYSNPIKNFVPGICKFETTEQNHSLALDAKSTFGRHPWHRDPARRDNPLANDQLEAMEMIVKDRPVYTFATINTSRKLQWAKLGPIRDVTAEAISQIDRQNTHTVTPVPRLIVSPGGFPNDISLYIAQRALELTKNAATDGGEILFLAQCKDGVGEEHTLENFYNRLTAPVESILTSIESDYKLYSHKPYKFAQLIKRLNQIWMHSEIPDEMVEAAHLKPAKEPQAVIDKWLADDPDTKITIIEGANKIALYANQ
ncbi:MAG: lactate racemase domain-containing protein [Planctomycetota bacterium]